MKLQNKLLIATHNQGKLREISSFLSDIPFKIVSLKDLGIKEDVLEDGKTYKENSIKKALFFSKLTGLLTVADDGGIEIDALNGAPGLHSRRWSEDEKEIIEKMKQIAKDLPQSKKGAAFKTVVSFALPNGQVWSFKGQIKGEIRDPYLKYLKGFPYRSFFYLPKLKKFYHEDELTKIDEKMYNHRYKAIQKLKPKILKYA